MPKPTARLVQLDFLRGVAILLVVGSHISTLNPKAGHLTFLPTLWRTFGWTGVDLFFVLSGFLIGGLLFGELHRTGQLDVRRFIIRRGFKIWPLYYLFLFAGAAASLLSHTSFPDSIAHVMPFAFHAQNYFMPQTEPAPASMRHLWSLGVEEHFYLLLPLLLVFLIRKKAGTEPALKALPVIAVGVMICCLLLRLYLLGRPFMPERNQYPTHLRIDSLACGVLLAYFWEFQQQVLQPWLLRPQSLLAVGCLLISPMCIWYIDSPFVFSIGFTMLYIGYGCILMACMASTLHQGGTDRFFRGRFARSVAGIGFFSYPIYLIHMWPGFLVANRISNWNHVRALPLALSWLLYAILALSGAILMGAVLGIVVEKPTLALRNRLFPAPAAQELVRDVSAHRQSS